jgi:hypothetical protein
MTKQEKLDLASDIADHTIDYIYETVVDEIDWIEEIKKTADLEYNEDKFMITHTEIVRLSITEIAKRLTNINSVKTLLTNMK